MLRASVRHLPALAHRAHELFLSVASHRSALSHMPTLQPLKVLLPQRSWIVHDVLQLVRMKVSGVSHLPRIDISTHRESRSMKMPCCFSHASH